MDLQFATRSLIGKSLPRVLHEDSSDCASASEPAGSELPDRLLAELNSAVSQQKPPQRPRCPSGESPEFFFSANSAVRPAEDKLPPIGNVVLRADAHSNWLL